MTNLQELLLKPVWQMTGEEFIFLSKHASNQTDDSAGERQKVHVHAQLPLLAHTLQSLHFIPRVYISGIKRSGCGM